MGKHVQRRMKVYTMVLIVYFDYKVESIVYFLLYVVLFYLKRILILDFCVRGIDGAAKTEMDPQT